MLRYDPYQQNTEVVFHKDTDLLDVACRVADGVDDTSEDPSTAECGRGDGVLQAGDERARQDYRKGLKSVLVCTWPKDVSPSRSTFWSHHAYAVRS